MTSSSSALLSDVFRVIGFIALVAALVAAYRVNRRKYLTQYLFFLRFPLLFGLAAVALPLLALCGKLPDTLNDLFIVGPIGSATVTFFATISAWAIVYTGELIAQSIPVRNKLHFDRAVQAGAGEPPAPPASLIGRRAFFYAEAIVLPLLVALVVKSDASGAGILVVLAAVLLAHLLASWVAGRKAQGLVDRFLGWSVTRHAIATAPAQRLTHLATVHTEADTPTPRAPRAAGFSRSNYERLHLTGATFAVVSASVYLLLGLLFVFWHAGGESVPALTYLMALSLVAVWALGWLSLKFDVYRVPIFTLILVVLSAWYSIWPHEHTYPAQPGDRRQLPDANAVLDRFAHRSADGTLVIVAASGGGIAAEYWTAVVLHGLGEDLLHRRPACDFHRHVAVVSSVSGGTVGCMYYLDAFSPDPGQTAARMPGMVQATEVNTLSSVAWGLAYPDTWRLAVGRALGRYDRGWRLERSWADRLSQPDLQVHDWTAGVVAAWRPLPLFNITVEETGERMVVSPAWVYDDDDPHSPFVRHMAAANLSVATAARLSASFPYVAPRALPNREVAPADFHGADGGYFDNSGVYSALNVLDRWLRRSSSGPNPPGGIARIALVEISPFPATDLATKQPAGDNVLDAIAGPVMTLYNVRTASQSARKDFEFSVLQDLWRRRYGVDLQRFTFLLASDPPLSWLLTAQERADIRAQWPAAATTPDTAAHDDAASSARLHQRNENREHLDRLAKFLTRTP